MNHTQWTCGDYSQFNWGVNHILCLDQAEITNEQSYNGDHSVKLWHNPTETSKGYLRLYYPCSSEDIGKTATVYIKGKCEHDATLILLMMNGNVIISSTYIHFNNSDWKELSLSLNIPSNTNSVDTRVLDQSTATTENIYVDDFKLTIQ